MLDTGRLLPAFALALALALDPVAATLATPDEGVSAEGVVSTPPLALASVGSRREVDAGAAEEEGAGAGPDAAAFPSAVGGPARKT